MSTEEIIIDCYKFKNFNAISDEITFTAENIDRRAITEKDRTKMEAFMKDIGKWECLISVGSDLFSELKIKSQNITKLQYQRLLETDEYAPVKVEIDDNKLVISVILTEDEYETRRKLLIQPVFSVEEVRKQVQNIPRWKRFHRTLKNINLVR